MKIQEIAESLNKKGVVFFETGPGGLVIEMMVVDPAFWEEDQLKWTALPTYLARPSKHTPTNYLITKGFEHYGPKISMKEDY